ncbi:phosphate signaling complex protein PhoU [Mycolicibacterium sp. J2]|uniref:phosphate signaling complex protein PhoU n=1 Tax=Mycolicibacterium sp. J2 TaxID=2993511 RepID=UPI00224B5745|nr:phosphate signaling complex protein PhoU [Mycolicibacterium sp. J2]MCX2710520.1 phosphate signaling complex protein PhoU [Mycolicibacterium sp. J2]
MRTEFHAEIDHLTVELGQMCEIAATVMTDATAALVHDDDDAAHRVGVELARLTYLHHSVDERAFAILARQAPVAHDLRVVMSAFPISADADRMGGLAANISKVSRRRGSTPVPPVALDVFAAMGRHAVALAERAHSAVLRTDLVAAQHITDGDEAMNALHRRLFTMVLDDRWEHGPIAAANVMLLGRFYERFADHAVSIARRVVFQASGQLPNIGASPM